MRRWFGCSVRSVSEPAEVLPAARRAGLEDVEKLLTNTIDATNKTALGAVK
jgi:hypothetical protein